jgi:hypothetical protein
MRAEPNTTFLVTPRTHAPAADTAAIITIAAVADETHVVDAVQWSYSEAPTGGSLTITVNAVTKFKIAITAAGPGFINFPQGLYGDVNQAVVITLAAGAGTCVGIVSAQTH